MRDATDKAVQILTTDGSLWYSKLERPSKEDSKANLLNRNLWVVAYRSEEMITPKFVCWEHIVAIDPLN